MKLHTAFPMQIDGESFTGIFEGHRQGWAYVAAMKNGLIVSRHSLPARLFDDSARPGRYVFKTSGHDFIIDTREQVSE